MDWEIVLKILLLLASGLFAIGTTIIIAEEKKRKRIKNHIDNLKEKEKMGFLFRNNHLQVKVSLKTDLLILREITLKNLFFISN